MADEGMRIDKPHEPWGPHVDDIQRIPKKDADDPYPGIVKTRIGPDGNIIDTDFNIKNR